MTTVDETPKVQPPRSGRDIRRWRLLKAMSLEDAANEMKVSPQTLDKAEREEKIILKSRKTIADYFDGLPEFDQIEVTILTIWPELMEDDE